MKIKAALAFAQRHITWLISAALLAVSVAYIRLPPHSAAQNCGLSEAELYPAGATDDPTAITISVWAATGHKNCGRVFVPALAAQYVTNYSVRVKPLAFETISDEPYQNYLHDALKRGNAPDITQITNSWEAPAMRSDGGLTPLDGCIARYPEFGNLDPKVLATLRADNQIWGVPIAVVGWVFYYNKAKLRAFGWSKEDIDVLPERIRTGKFTLQDAADVAEEAIRMGVVQEGFGFWDSDFDWGALNKIYPAFLPPTSIVAGQADQPLVVNQQALAEAIAFHQSLIVRGLSMPQIEKMPGSDGALSIVRNWVRRDVYAETRFLFGIAANTEWAVLGMDKTADRGGFDYLQATIGRALIPSARHGQAGYFLWDTSLTYVIPNTAATGRHNQDAACEVLARALRPDILAWFAYRSGSLPPVRLKQDKAIDAPVQNAFKDSYMLDYLLQMMWTQPSYVARGLAFDEIERAPDIRSASPHELAQRVVSRLRATLQDKLVVQ